MNVKDFPEQPDSGPSEARSLARALSLSDHARAEKSPEG
jgi:hypothetical protein